MKHLITTSLLLINVFGFSQNSENIEKKTYLKANAVFLPIGILNAGIETQLSKKYTFQGDVFISPWKSFAGKYAQAYMAGIEGRYYFDEAFKHWYLGANFSAAVYRLQKWNYWSDEPYQYSPESPVYVHSDLYQKGFSLFFGATVGYQFIINNNWNIDLYLGAGSSQDHYRGYVKSTGERYDDPSRKWNKSGEWIPYRGGVMISYRIK